MVQELDIDPGDDPTGDVPPGADIAAAAAVAAGAACLSCGARLAGEYCSNCGQSSDDLRRSLPALGWDFLKDTFAFDSRMWRTLGLMATAPGLVPTNYSHGRRSRYTPPVRLFLVVSFLFFLALSLTQTLFIAIEVSQKTPEEAAAEAATTQTALERSGVKFDPEDLVVIDGATIDCALNVRTRFFVRARDVKVDPQAWRRCADSIRASAKVEIENDPERGAAADDAAKAMDAFNRVITGLSTFVEDPRTFNADINTWLPRVVFFMAPVLALLISVFIRGKDALLFDHLVLSLYSHAAAFAVVGAAIVATQLGVKHAGTAAAAVLAVYFIAALKRAYKRGWIKTVFATAFVALFYLVILSSVVMTIVMNVVWRSA